MANDGLKGNKLYQKRARRALPLLVNYARAGLTVTYDTLAKQLGMPNPRNLNYVLGTIGDELQGLSKKIPPIQSLVINKATHIPGPGFYGYLKSKHPNIKRYGKSRKLTVVETLHYKIFNYKDWNEVIRKLGLRNTSTRPVQSRNSRGKGGGEGPEHKKLKSRLLKNPLMLNVKPPYHLAKDEWPLLSGDKVDIAVECSKAWYLIEVKSKISDVSDVRRGLYQCLKYRAVHSAYNSKPTRTILALGRKFPKELGFERKRLGIKVAVIMNNKVTWER